MNKFECSLLLSRQIFTREDESAGMLYLRWGDLQCTVFEIETISKKRWNVETFNKTITANPALKKPPTKTLLAQRIHVFMSIYLAFKLECLSVRQHLNHLTLKAKLYAKAIKHAFCEIKRLKSCIMVPASGIN